MRLVCLFFLTFVICNSAKALDDVERIHSIVDPQYEIEGHHDTTEIICHMVGCSDEQAIRISYFSQAPDDLWVRFSAPSVAIWGFFYPLYRQRIMTVLHSLHGGSNPKVLTRRQDLINLIKSYDLEDCENHWKVGFLIHALGDSYAHAYGEKGNLTSYNSLYGHLLDNCDNDRCNQPDVIIKNDNYIVFNEYLTALSMALDRSGLSKPPIAVEQLVEELKAEIIRKVEIENITNDEFKEFIRTYKTGIVEEKLPNHEKSDLSADLTISNVDNFLKEIESKFTD